MSPVSPCEASRADNGMQTRRRDGGSGDVAGYALRGRRRQPPARLRPQADCKPPSVFFFTKLKAELPTNSQPIVLTPGCQPLYVVFRRFPVTAGIKRESGAIPELPRSGKWKRTSS